MNFICKDKEIEIPKDAPFKYDKLKRESIATILTSMVEIYSHSGAVIAIDGEWGTGKTTFINMWRQFLDNNDYKTLYFNAWNADYIDDPLIALMGELNFVFRKNKTFKEFTKNLGNIGLVVGGEVVKGGAKKLTGFDTDAVSAGIDEIVNIGKKHIETYGKRKKEIEVFKNKLGEFVASEAQESNHPIIFFVDELDRCNPHFAVKLLERIKHLFEVPNVIFVLSINLSQFKHAIEGYYGSNNINGEEYLKRFIDLTYTLPKPDLEAYVDHLYNLHSFDEFFNHEDRRKAGLKNEGESFLYLAKDLISNSNLNLRTINKIFVYTRIALQSFTLTTKVNADIFFLLCFLKLTNNKLYNQIKLSELTIEDLIIKLEDFLPPNIFAPTPSSMSDRHIAWAIGGLLIKYNYTERGMAREKVLEGKEKEGQSYPEYPIKVSKLSKELLFEAINWYQRNDRYYEYGLKTLIDRIDLINYIHI